MKTVDILVLSYKTVTSNKLRTGITVAIIAFGIMALIGIITAIQAMNQSIKESFSTLGANAFAIRYKDRNINIGGRRSVAAVKKGARPDKNSNVGKKIDYLQAKMFKEHFKFPSIIGLQLNGPSSVVAKYGNKETTPEVQIRGGDENFLLINGYTLQAGRNFSRMDVETGRSVCFLGSEIAEKLFPSNPEAALEKIIRIANLPYRVVGLLRPKGSSAFLQMDKVAITSYNNVRRLPNAGTSYTINVMVDDLTQLEPAIGEATGTLRAIRRLDIKDNDNFFIDKSDSLAETFISLLSSISGSAGAIGLITLIGAAIGLMNIMLVAVTERTKEVGLIKALGGTRKSIRNQFLFESIIISLLGAVFGIVLGVLVGNAFAMAVGTGFVVPWGWVVTGIIICSIVGLTAGLWPAIKASKLDPIVALRYE
ncbi:ABC transporter permease [Segetibacter sp.]|jgi:putative ABC transport system permease protein|uniref:ABC transporter permease n=1 Tax=Segetibacter sp. TaxID=2231182 RepID=UPI0026258F1C|nr:ABC transporter permease [Segetibacter sp.]MCW3078739.1 cell division protein FtsX [Segetibacter sp.]